MAARPYAPPVLLCGEDDLTLMTRAIEGGIYDYIPLPLDPVDLSRKVAQVAPGKSLSITLYRDGKERNVTLEVASQPKGV